MSSNASNDLIKYPRINHPSQPTINRSRSRSRSKNVKRHRKKSKKSRKRKRKRRHSPSYEYSSISDYTSDSSSSSYSKSKKKKAKKKKKERKERRKKRKSKKKKKHSKYSSLLNDNSSIVKPDEYKQGQFGFIGVNDLFSKLPEFTSWLIEVHNVSRDELGTRDEKKYFARFCDDFNTATMPDVKYYNLEDWNRKYIERNENQMVDKFGTDEEQLRRQRKEYREQQTNKAYQERVSAMMKEVKHLKKSKTGHFDRLVEKHAPKKETFESLAAKRRQKKVEERVKRYGKYGGNVVWE